MESAEFQFWSLGIQYYVAARSAAIAGLLPVTGNLYHHAIEMMLKAALSRTIGLRQLDKKYKHRLSQLWEKFKQEFPSIQASEFDSLINNLNKWEEIRYPDKTIASGVYLEFEWTERIQGTSCPVQTVYRLNGLDIDALVVAVFEAASINIKALMGSLNPYARETISRYNSAPGRML